MSAGAPALRSVSQGTAVRADMLADKRYRDLLVREFDVLTPENEMKMAALSPRRGVYDFAAADELVRFARRYGKSVRGHALVWGLDLPLWLLDRLGLGKPLNDLLSPWTRPELLALMNGHIRTVVGHYGERVLEWDVVNEPLNASGALADNVWKRGIGVDYVEQALRTARAANPRAKLFINEYAVGYPGPKQDGLYALARDLKARGVPLDGIGIQAHTHILGFMNEATLTAAMRRFADLGLQVQITEMDVGTSALDLALPERLTRQAEAYGAAARACNAVRACTRFTTWGFTDAVSWLGRGEAALLFDARYRPKPAFGAVRSAFASRFTRRYARRGSLTGCGSCWGRRAGRR